ncbi:MAG TPA: DNA polymerase IV [Steroidobacteraceae bacterium]|nr:DNA polymerase IV [Steroidobacteraceae bacterium]
MSRAVLHVDMDAFYASVEQHDDPSLAGLPVIVGGTSGRGVVAAASYEVRKYGVHSAMPMSTALRLCPHARCVAPRMGRYKEVSQQVFGVFHEVTPLVEGLSLDEAFLDVTDSRALLGDAVTIARGIKTQIRTRTGLTASVGVAPNKLVAKIASDLAKPDGLTVVPEDRIAATLDPLSIRRLPGLGRKTGEKVEALGIHTFAQLRTAADSRLWPVFGRYTRRIRERAAGVDDRAVVPDHQEKSISAEDTFERDVSEARALLGHLSRLADRACTRLRGKQLVAGKVGVKIRQHDFRTFSRQRVVAPAAHDGRTLSRMAEDLLRQWLTENPGAKLRLLGVVLSDLSPAAQLGLFEEASPHASRLDATVDEARARFGSRALRRGNTIE